MKLKGAQAGSGIQDSKSCEECEDQAQTGNFPMDVYKEHLRVRQIIINGVIDDSMVEKVTLQISKFNEMDDEREAVDRTYDRMNNPITIKLSSPGGFVDQGLGIISQIVQSDTPVISYAVGDCSSMAALIFAVSHVRICAIYSRIMFHSLSSGYIGTLMGIVEKAEELKKVQKVLDSIVTSRTLITQKQLDAMHSKKEDWYLNSAEALALGVADEVMQPGLKMVPVKKRKTPTANKDKKK